MALRTRGARALAVPATIGAALLSTAIAPGQAGAVPMLGINEHGFVAQSDPAVDPDRISALVRATGARSQRFTLSWRAVQPRPGIWNWGRFDRGVQAMRRVGLQPLIIIEEAPNWATGSDCLGRTCPPTDSHLGSWARFAERVARRYGNALAIEIYHGVNWKGHWNTIGGPNPERYARVFAAAARAIHVARPGMPVLIGGISAGVERDEPRGSMTPGTYLPRFYRALDPRVLRPTDGLAIRAFPSPRDLSHGDGRVGRHLRAVRSVLRRYDPRRRIWITEAGATTSGPNRITPQRQGEVIEALLDRLRNAKDVAAISIHRLVERPNPDRPQEFGYGIVRPGPTFAPKPAYCRLVNRVVGPADKVGCAGLGGPRLRFAGVRRNKRAGTARLKVMAPGPGKLVLERTGKLKRAVKKPGRAGVVRLDVRARGAANRKLKRARRSGRWTRVRTKARVTFHPDHSGPARIARPLRLVVRR